MKPWTLPFCGEQSRCWPFSMTQIATRGLSSTFWVFGHKLLFFPVSTQVCLFWVTAFSHLVCAYAAGIRKHCWIQSCENVLKCFHFLFEKGSHGARVVLNICLEMTLNFWSSCLHPHMVRLPRVPTCLASHPSANWAQPCLADGMRLYDQSPGYLECDTS